MQPRVFVVSGPSGVGKSTIITRVLASEPALRLSVSLTTRPQRPGETDGEHYHFVSRPRFEAMIERGEFLEWARVYDHYYGTSRRHVEGILAAGHHALLDLDTQGAMSIRRGFRGAVLIFIKAPSMAELETRLRTRGTEDEASLAKRMDRAGHELSFSDAYDHTIVNDRVEKAVEAFLEIVHQEGERPVKFTAIDNHPDETIASTAERAVRYALQRIDEEALVQSLSEEVKDALRIELEELIRERLEHVLSHELEHIVAETWRVLRER